MTKNNSSIRVNPVAEKIVKSGLKVVFKNMFNVRLHMPVEVEQLKPPFVLLPNHQGFWDPFLAGVYLKPPVYYITSDAVFRSRIFGFLLKFLGAIPKTKSQSDLDALKNVFEMKERGHSIGIFAEGQRTWDGRTLPLIKSTAKLIRILRIPVVTVVFKGGFYSQPRWGTSIRKGELVIDYKLLFKEDEIGEMKITEIHDAITVALSHDEVEYQKQMEINYQGGKYAGNIDQFLFVCPSCRSFKGFESCNNTFTCSKCGKNWQISSTQLISAGEGESCFDNVRDWDEWQLEQMRKLIDEKFNEDEIIFSAENVVFFTGYKSRRLKWLSAGSVTLSGQRFTLYNKKREELVSIPVAEIYGINVQNKEVLDFYFGNILYTVSDRKKHFNAYKIWRAVDYIQREKMGLNLPD